MFKFLNYLSLALTNYFQSYNSFAKSKSSIEEIEHFVAFFEISHLVFIDKKSYSPNPEKELFKKHYDENLMNVTA